jgi:hypothetical protein
MPATSQKLYLYLFGTDDEHVDDVSAPSFMVAPIITTQRGSNEKEALTLMLSPPKPPSSPRGSWLCKPSNEETES